MANACVRETLHNMDPLPVYKAILFSRQSLNIQMVIGIYVQNIDIKQDLHTVVLRND